MHKFNYHLFMRLKQLVKLAYVLFLSVIFHSESTFAIDYQKIINHVNSTPAKAENSTQELSAYLCRPFDSETEKFAVIYYWVAKNITYNYSLSTKNLYYENIDQIIDHAVKYKNGVCQHYSELFVRLCQHKGLTAFVVGGYTQTNGKIDELSHAWNIIKVNGKWYFVDATWAGSAVQENTRSLFPNQFFMIRPEENIKTRMPFDPIWQALSKPLKYHEFDKGFVNQVQKGNFNYNDSINKHLRLNRTQRYQASVKRIRNNGIQNQIVKNEYALMKRNYKMLLYNQEVDKYNAASVFYNKGMHFYNNYARLKNNKSSYLSKTKKQLNTLIDSSIINLEKAQKLTNTIKGDEKMQSHIIKNEKTIKKIKAILLKEKQFVKDNF